MKICQVINSLSSGGAEVFTSQLAVALSKKGNDVSLVTYQGVIDKKGQVLHDYLLQNGVKVYHMKGFKKGNIGYIFAFFYLLVTIFKIRPKIVHAHLQLSDFFILFVNKLLFFRDMIIIRTVHNKRRAARLNFTFEKMMFEGYNHNIACSDFVRDNYENPILRPLLYSIPNGIDLTECNRYMELNKLELRKELNLPLDKVILFNIGSMYLSDNSVSKKNQQFIIDALKGIKESNQAFCLFIGDGTLKSQFEDEVVKSGLNDKVKFTGNVLNVYKYIMASDFCVMPSLDEGLPIALIETVCSGKFAITSNIDAFLPFNANSVHRLKTFEVEELQDEIDNTIINISELNRLGVSNISYFRNIFDIDIVADKYLSVYKK